MEVNHLDRRSNPWIAVEECDLDDFPILTDEQLRSITCGVYQLKLSPSYIQEYVEGDSVIQVHREDSHLLCVKIQSRHISSKQYKLWIKYSSTAILSWYCKCRAGARVVGVCSHIAAVVWYLSSARHDVSRETFGVRNWSHYLSDATDLPDTVDSSDTDSSVVEE